MPVLEPVGAAAPDRAVQTDRRTIIHSDHYNLALVRTVLSTEKVDARSILETAAAELAFQSLRERAIAEGWRGQPRSLDGAAHLFRSMGLGFLDMSHVVEAGGEVRVTASHFTLGWTEKYGRSKQPVCSVATGFISGALSAAFGRAYKVVETSCRAQGKPECRFKVSLSVDDFAFSDVLPTYRSSPVSLPAPAPSSFDEAAVVAALHDVLPSGRSQGQIPGFGGSVTRLWSEFYSHVSYRFEREVPRALGAKFSNLPILVLVEAGHFCAFHTFGGLMRSEEWRSRVAPLLSSREDWLHAAIAVVNTLGWGSWRVNSLVPGHRAGIRVYDSYEAEGYRQRFDRATAPKCYLARGVAAALMNLIYVGDVTEAPELTPSYYNQLFRSPLSFRAVESRCRATDDPYCELIVNPLSPGLTARLLLEDR